MGSADIVKWITPKIAAEWKWKQERGVRLKALKTWLLWFPPLAAITGYIIYRLDPTILLRLVFSLIASYVIFPLWFYLIMWLQSKLELPGYVIRDKGLLIQAGRSSKFYHWIEIEYYRISDSEEIPGLRKLEFKSTKRKKIEQWFFDPNDVDESRINTSLNGYLIGKYWENFPNG